MARRHRLDASIALARAGAYAVAAMVTEAVVLVDRTLVLQVVRSHADQEQPSAPGVCVVDRFGWSGRRLLRRIECDAIILECHHDCVAVKLEGNRDLMFPLVRIRMPDDVGGHFIEHQFAVVAGASWEIVLVQSLAECPKGLVESRTRSMKRQDLTSLHSC